MNERLKILRKKLNLTQQEFANKIGSKRNTIAKYETCANTPSTAVVSLICKTFNVNEEWLRFGNGEMFIEEDVISLDDYAKINNLTELEKKLAIGFMNLSPEIREAVFSVLENTFSNDRQNTTLKETSATAELSQAVKEAEEAYIKSRSKPVKKTEQSASSITEENAILENAANQ